MRKNTFGSLLLLSGLLALPFTAKADEGMFLFTNPPQQQVHQSSGFTITQPWLDHAMHAAVRFNNGGSGGFISADGLVITNHHVASDALADLSVEGRDLYANGFLARTRAEELRVPNLELNCLDSITDVTEQVNQAVTAKMSPAQAAKARSAQIARLEAASQQATGLRSDVVELYHGGLYHLYRYKKYTDIRLVWAPESAAAAFGGDVDNFEYPRESVDVSFFRVYENGQPLHPAEFFKFDERGVVENELVFAVGHPGSTSRQMTCADLKNMRDFRFPFTMASVQALEAAMQQYSERGARESLQAQNARSLYANSRKVYGDMYNGLADSQVIEILTEREKALRAKAASDKPWQDIEKIRHHYSTFAVRYNMLEGRSALNSPLFAKARHLVRLAAELPKANHERLPEYSDSRIDSLKQSLLADDPIYNPMEIARLTASLTFLAQRLGVDDPDVQLILKGKSPAQRARELVWGSRMNDLAERRQLLKGGASVVELSQDSMVVLARELDKRSRELRSKWENEVDEPLTKAYQQIAEERFRQNGTSVPPDATFTLRLSYGFVKPYTQDGVKLDWQTTVADLYRVNSAHADRAPYNIPESWLKVENSVDTQAQLVFVSTADITGGNSGSPMIDKAGNIVGVCFDSNRSGNVNDFVYSEKQARCLSVGTPVIATALKDVYNAKNLVKELGLDK